MKEEQEHGYTGTQIQRFFEPILKAEAEAEMDLVTVVTDKAKVEGDWKAAAFLLEKRFKYNNRQEVELSTNDEESNKININITKMSEKHGKPECGDDEHSDGVD
ncbi:hypothetical protein [Methanobrevibacter smithii]|uniref:hypothetical protein n=1 Tax=Methanobrevibacter smithii TaxID=2173 RepID=UPI001C00EF9F|nr:hypothetical protein [Methanobrevibacter smithii]MBT9657859.1 hypothetical protein [Methanobrevibacter smithii]